MREKHCVDAARRDAAEQRSGMDRASLVLRAHEASRWLLPSDRMLDSDAMNARPINLADLIEVMADRIGDRPAFITEDREFTYAEIDERATRLANHLVSTGIKPGDRVAVHAMNRIEWVDAFYGTIKARAVPININYRYLHNELKHVYADSESVMAIVAPEFVDAVKEIQDKVPALKGLLVLGEQYDAALAAARRSAGSRAVPPTTTTSSTPAAQRGCPRAWSGGRRTSSAAP